MANRNIVIPIDLTKTGGVIVPTEGKVVYTSDTVSLIFNITGVTDYTGMNAAVALVMADGSVFQHERPITATPATFLLQDNEVAHAGMVVGQVRFTDSSGSLTSQEFIFSIQASILDMPENLGGTREIEIDSFETLKEQVEGIQATVVANWDIVQANLDTMEAGFAADWSAWFTSNQTSIMAQWTALKADVTAKQATLAQDIATAEANELERVSAESVRLTAEGSRITSEGDRAEEEAARTVAESGRITKEALRVSKETERVSAEATRETSESTRVAAEFNRLSQENIRVSREEARVSQENARKSAESARTATASEDHNTAVVDHDTITNLFQNSSVVLSVDEYMQMLADNSTLPTIRYIVTDSTLEEFLGAPLT